MLRATKWKLEKAKVKVVFRLQFHATNIPQSGWDKLFICLIPIESGKIIAKTSKANVRNGACKWADPIYETTRLLQDARNKRYDDKLYNLIVGMGTSRASILGEATINLAEYADASSPLVVSLPLDGSDHGILLHVTVQLLTAKTGFREFEQQFDRGLQSSSNLNREVEPSFATSLSSELTISEDHGNKVNTETHLGSEPKELITIVEETGIHEEFSECYYSDKHELPSIHESRDSNGPTCSQSPTTEKPDQSNHQGWNSDYSMNNNLAIAHEENHRLRGSLEMAEASISELKLELIALHTHANEMGMETQNISQHLMAEISSGQKLEREIMVLKSECSKFKDELQKLKEVKSRPKSIERTQAHQPTWANGLLLVENRIRELQQKIPFGITASNLNSDLEVLLGILHDLEKETVFTNGFDSVEGKSFQVLREVDELKTEKGNLIRKMDEMECYYEALVQELEENQKRILGEFQSLRYEHSTCVYTISTCKAETEMTRRDMNNQILRFIEERQSLGCVNEDLTKRVASSEVRVQELEKNREQILKEFKSLKNEHSTCAETITTYKSETESIRRDMNNQTLKFAKERHALGCLNEELEKKVNTAESRVRELEGELQSLKNEHSKCVDSILTCKSEIEMLKSDERHDSGCVNEDLEKRVLNAESRVRELEENRECILEELESLKSEHSTCADAFSTCKSETELIRDEMNDKISKLTEEIHALDSANKELEKNREQILGEFESLKNEHSTCIDTISTCKLEIESIRNEMNNKISNFIEEKHALDCVNGELEKRVVNAEARVQELEKNREQILKEFESLKNEHSTCKFESDSIHDEMKEKILKFTEEKHDLERVNKELEKRVTTAESALVRARSNYSIAVTQLQKDLDMLSGQVASMFETNQNLIKGTFSESLIIENDNEKHEKKDPEREGEGGSESLRMAFMKEQCETTVQELKQQLLVSKRDADNILFKLQDALDEIDSRKKSEASYLKKIEELSFKIVGLEAELESLHSELECALLNLECCKEEKQKIVSIMEECEEEKMKIALELSLLQDQIATKQKMAGDIAQINKLEGLKKERSILSMMSSGSNFQDLQRELVQLHKANEELGGIYPNFTDLPGDGNALKRVLALEIELAEALTSKNKSSIRSSFLKQHSDEEAVFKSFRDINEVIKDMLEMKNKYVDVENELKEMHERYLELSLQFAEVEGERQKLMMTVKNSRSPSIGNPR
ncbi:hypothetical protein Lser_V15G00136 [Lactuca serriola]